jgi:hypothetical protein
VAGTAAALFLAAAPAGAAGQLRITSVERRGDRVTIRGTASLGAPAAPAVAPALVADAGNSAFVKAGEKTVLLGTAFGGTPPYTFAWSAPVGKLQGADAATAELDTTGVKAGAYTLALAIRDAAGARATDTVRVAVSFFQTKRILEETKSDLTPGVGGTTSIEFPFTVPPGTDRIDVKVSWKLLNDYDLRVIDPKGKERDSSGNPPPQPETASVADPEPGGWKLLVDKYATAGDQVLAEVDAQTIAVDPRPAVSPGGPYRFRIADAQALSGTVSGGAAPVRAGWDTDQDGVIDLEGAKAVAHLEEGRHLVTFRAVDARGFERRQTTSVLVANDERLRLDTAAVTVIAVADTGINPYHLEFSAETYPDPDVLALTHNFTRHPSEYIPGYPTSAEALRVTLGKGYFPARDKPIWEQGKTIQPGKLYWIPGTKIIGAVATTGGDPHPILDDNGHGDGSASVSAGNRYGYCPTCLLVVVEGLDETVATRFPWVDISSHSFGYVGGIPAGLIAGPNDATRDAVERGQTVLFAAGNGVGNFFDVPQITWGSDQDGAPWNITVGALRRDTQRAIFGDGIPAHLSAWGDGDLPSACRAGTVGQCAFGGTSAATPYTAGVFGTVLSEVRRALGDMTAGQRPRQVVAKGARIAASPYLSDGMLTRSELREAVFATAMPLNQSNTTISPWAHPVAVPYVPLANVLFEGYGAATPESAKRAVDVLLGRAQMPDRTFEDAFFEVDAAVREAVYGMYDHDGDGVRDGVAPEGLRFSRSDVATLPGALAAFRKVAALRSSVPRRPLGTSTLTWYLHRVFSDPATTASDEIPPPEVAAAVPSTTTVRCSEENNEFFMTAANTPGDLDPCFNQRTSTVAAAFRPLAIWPTRVPIDAPLPAGSTVNVELLVATELPSVVRPAGVLLATDREIGTGAATVPLPVLPSGLNGSACAFGEACWTKFEFSFATTRPAFSGEQITFQAQMAGSRSWAFGYEGAHASKVMIEPAPLPSSGLDFGVTIAPASAARAGQQAVVGGTASFPDLGSDPTGAGDHPTRRRVEVSLDDRAFGRPIAATLDEKSGSWTLSLGSRAAGTHTVYARAAMDRQTSAVASGTVTIEPDAVVQWQLVSLLPSSVPDPARWKTAQGVSNWSFTMNAAGAGAGPHAVLVRLVREGVEVARTSVARLDGSDLPATGLGFRFAGLWLLAAAGALAGWRRRGRHPIFLV